MMLLPTGVRVWIAAGHTDMRRGMHSLALQVQQGLKRDPHAVRLTAERAKVLNSRLPIIARSHSARLGDELVRVGERVRVIQGETELAIQMTRYALRRFGLSMAEAEAVAQGLRGSSSGR